ncbi:hypothetical protein NJC40_12815 [Pseudomonas sp. 21LCFQ02]|uniref:hypothetical protein n=1 Tax=unclassified Pseudomonas TaxID=196821 RepID=UPI0004F77913|nr:MULTISPECIES: hypothetical protein [unclassified Pseudomonas]MCO8168651.1 hypothetical protein [Pseudomonas sp. 21LCFQ02]MCQ9423035.1 hypothetical protein [Pseudomonas sp. LJDD11]BAP45120.1 putative uncharacterized protein [Pseudomonas sp. StFLB209]
MHRKIFPLVILATALVGCSDPKKASESNFEKATQAWLDTAYPKCFLMSAFPTESKEFDIGNSNKMLHALAGAGVLKEVELSRKEIPASIFQSARTQVQYSYDLTDEGRKYYKADAQKLRDGSTAPGLCIGKAKVTKIEQFSEPGDMMGQKISRVTYTYRVDDLPKWASDQAVVETNRELGPMVSSKDTPIKETRAFILTNNGWVHERLFGK